MNRQPPTSLSLAPESPPASVTGGSFADKEAVLASLEERRRRREAIRVELGLKPVPIEEARAQGAAEATESHAIEQRDGDRREALEAGYVSRLSAAIISAQRANASEEAVNEVQHEIASMALKQREATGGTTIPPVVATQLFIEGLRERLFGGQAAVDLVAVRGGDRVLCLPPPDLYAPKRVGRKQRGDAGAASREETWSLRSPGSLPDCAPFIPAPSADDRSPLLDEREEEEELALGRTLGDTNPGEDATGPPPMHSNQYIPPRPILISTNPSSPHSQSPRGGAQSAGASQGTPPPTRLLTLQELVLSHSVGDPEGNSGLGGLPPKYRHLPVDLYGNVDLEGVELRRRIPLSEAMDTVLSPDGHTSLSSVPSSSSFSGEHRMVFNKEFPVLEEVLAVKLVSDPPPTDNRSRRARRVQILSNNAQPTEEPLERDELCEGMLVIQRLRVDTHTGRTIPPTLTQRKLRLAPPTEQKEPAKRDIGRSLVVEGTLDERVGRLLELDREHELLVERALGELRREAQQQELARQLQVAQEARRSKVCEPLEGVRAQFYFPSAEQEDPPYLQRLQTLQGAVRNVHLRFQFSPAVRTYLCGHRVGAGCFPFVQRTFRSIFSANLRITPRQLRNNLQGLSGGVLSDSKVKRLLFTVCPVQEAVLLETLNKTRAVRRQEVEMRIRSVTGRETSALRPQVSARRLVTRVLSVGSGLRRARQDQVNKVKQGLANMPDGGAASLKAFRGLSFKNVRFASSAASPVMHDTDPVERVASAIRDDAWVSDVDTESITSNNDEADATLEDFDVNEEIRPNPTKPLIERVAALCEGVTRRAREVPGIDSEEHPYSASQLGVNIAPLIGALELARNGGIGNVSASRRKGPAASVSPTLPRPGSRRLAPVPLALSASWASSDIFDLGGGSEGESIESDDDVDVSEMADTQCATASTQFGMKGALTAARSVLNIRNLLSDASRKNKRDTAKGEVQHDARRSRRPYPIGAWLNYPFPAEWVQGRFMAVLEAAIATKGGGVGASGAAAGSNRSVLLDVYDMLLPRRFVEARAEYTMQVRRGLIPPSGSTWVPPNLTSAILEETLAEVRTLVLHERATLGALEAHAKSQPVGAVRGATDAPSHTESELRAQRHKVRAAQARLSVLRVFVAEFHPFIQSIMDGAVKAYQYATRSARAARKRTPAAGGGVRIQYLPKDFAPIPVQPRINGEPFQQLFAFPQGFVEPSFGAVSGWGTSSLTKSNPPGKQDVLEPQPYNLFGGFAHTEEDKAVLDIIVRMETVQNGAGDAAAVAAELAAEAKSRIAAFKLRRKVEKVRLKASKASLAASGQPTAELSAKRDDAMYRALVDQYNRLLRQTVVKSSLPSVDSCGPQGMTEAREARRRSARWGDEGGVPGDDDDEEAFDDGGLGAPQEGLSKDQMRLLGCLSIRERSQLVDAVLSGVCIRPLPTAETRAEEEAPAFQQRLHAIQQHNERVSLGRALAHHLGLSHLATANAASGSQAIPSAALQAGKSITTLHTDPRVPVHLRTSPLLTAGEPLYYECFGKLLQTSPPFAMLLVGLLLHSLPPRL